MLKIKQLGLIILCIVPIIILIIGTIKGINGMITGGVIGIFIAAIIMMMIMIQCNTSSKNINKIKEEIPAIKIINPLSIPV